MRIRKKITFVSLFLLLLSLSLFFTAYAAYHKLWIFQSAMDKRVAGISTKLYDHTSQSTDEIKKNDKLKNVVEGVLSDADGKYGAVVVNLNTDEYYFYNEHTQFQSASLYKLWVMAVVYQEIEKGNLKETDVLSDNLASLYNTFQLSTDSADLQQQTISLTVSNALYRMITFSDNDAALLLTKRVGLPKISDFLHKYRLNESYVALKGGNPVTSPADVSIFLMRLYAGDFADQEDTQKMLGLLKEQQINNKLPKYLPDKVTIAHKTGELDQFSHDAGIVYTKEGDYVIVVLSETPAPGLAEERMALLSKAIYDYFLHSQ